ncbi:hypothetical protein PHLCEN_2v5059 [Hermanssonia centrifuga]|uniref:Uncharacterized protein n=1 Tax=Hermanssonia centrifuga TaxID=98765 RepID=A0A2R6PC87_9APHY|nr:hypothetical protein PHLCEN_2v5059 [Hermanssonia centrifuga]
MASRTGYNMNSSGASFGPALTARGIIDHYGINKLLSGSCRRHENSPTTLVRTTLLHR